MVHEQRLIAELQGYDMAFLPVWLFQRGCHSHFWKVNCFQGLHQPDDPLGTEYTRKRISCVLSLFNLAGDGRCITEIVTISSSVQAFELQKLPV
jgi:hypothetical protein